MYPRVKDVKPTNDYKVILTFTNDEVKIFDVTPYLEKGFFKQLKDKSYFKNVKPFMDSIRCKMVKIFVLICYIWIVKMPNKS